MKGPLEYVGQTGGSIHPSTLPFVVYPWREEDPTIEKTQDPTIEGRARHSQECFFPPRGGFNLRCTRERYIPKNVFFLREEVLIYDAPSRPANRLRIGPNVCDN